MTIQRLVSGNGSFSEEILSCINDVTPKRHHFKKYDNILGYDNSRILVDRVLKDNALGPCLKDTFLMLVRMIICRHMKITFNITDYIGSNPSLYFHDPMIELRYLRFQTQHKLFLNNKADPIKLLDFSYILACINRMRITGDAATCNRLLATPIPDEFIDEVREMLVVFSNSFFGSKHLSSIENFVPSPCFSRSINTKIKNLNPELVVNNTLYLFDLSESPNIDSSSISSLVIYNLLRLSERALYYQNPLFDVITPNNTLFMESQIDRIAIFKVRYGSLEYSDLNEFMKTSYIESINRLLNKIGYKTNAEMLEQIFK